jgi:hypothetical protein
LSVTTKWAIFSYIITRICYIRFNCGRSWVRTPDGSNQRLWNWYLLLLR